MRILVLSDSHGDRYRLFEAFEREPEAEIVYLLGDGTREMQELTDAFGDKAAFIEVRGNCDFYSDYPENDIRSVDTAKIYACHGQNEQVKYSYNNIVRAARENGCNIALFGHTHLPYYEYRDKVHLLNPGSIREGNYAVIDILPAGILCTNKKLLD